MLTRSYMTWLRKEVFGKTHIPSTKNRQRKEKLMKVCAPNTSNGQQRVLRQTPYRLAKHKALIKLTSKNNIGFNHFAIDQSNSTPLVASRCRNYNKKTASPNTTRSVQENSDVSVKKTTLVSFKIVEKQFILANIIGKANITIRQFIVKMKIKPTMLLLILLAVLTILALIMMNHDATNDRTESQTWDHRYNEFTQEILDLQKQYTHQSDLFWHIIRDRGLRALTKPSYQMPMALLVVIPYRQEQVGRCLATKIVSSFNKVHNQKSTKQSNILLFYRQTETTSTIKALSLDIQAARDTRMNAVLIDHLEKLPRETVPTLDNFIQPHGYNAENQFLVFTLYLPSIHCNPEFVWDYLSYIWLNEAVHWPTLVRRLKYNTIFLNSDDAHVKCK